MSWLFVAKGTIHCRKSFTGKWRKITTVHQNYTVREYMSAPLHRYDINYTGQQFFLFFLHQRCKFFLMNEFHWFQICPGFWFSQYIIICTMEPLQVDPRSMTTPFPIKRQVPACLSLFLASPQFKLQNENISKTWCARKKKGKPVFKSVSQTDLETHNAIWFKFAVNQCYCLSLIQQLVRKQV